MMLDSSPLITVIINCYNSETFLKEAIDSVYAQTFTNWEIVFYDNNSTDNSALIAKSYKSKLRYIKRDNTILLGAARNEAVALALGKYVAFLDCDDVWFPEKLERLISTINSSLPKTPCADVGLVYSNAMRINSRGEDMNIPFSFGRELKSGNVYFDLLRDCFIGCSTVLVDRNIFYKAGGFDVNYNQVEDLDLWIKIARCSTVAVVNEILTKSRIHEGNVSRNVMAHIDEKIDLMRKVSLLDRNSASVCKKTIKFLIFQKKVVEFLFLVAQKKRKKSLRKSLEILTSYISAPLVCARVAIRFLNPAMINLFRRKYMSNS